LVTWVENLLGNWVIRFRWWILGLICVVVAASAIGIGQLEINNDTRVFIGEENPQYQALKALEYTFSKEQSVLFIVAPKSGDVFTANGLAAVIDLTEAGWHIPYAVGVHSISDYPYMRREGDDLVVEQLVDDPSVLSEAKLERARRLALSEPPLINRLISPSGHVAGVFVNLAMPAGQPQTTPEVAQAAERTIQAMREQYPGIDFYLTGSVMVDQAFGQASKDDFLTLAPVMFLVSSIIIGLALRSLFGVLAAIVVILLTMITGLGLTGWLGIRLTAASVSGPGLILTLAVADCVHLLSTMFHEMREGRSKQAAIARSVQVNLQAVFLTSLTTVIGFLSLNFSESPPFRDLGNIVAIGVAVAFFYAILLLPALMAVLPTSAGPAQKNYIRILCDRLADFVIRRRAVLLWSMLAVGVGTSVGIRRIELNDNFLTYFDGTFAFRRATDFLIENLGGWDIIEYPLSAGESGGIADPEYLALLDRFAEWYRGRPKVIYVNSLSTMMKRFNRDMHGGDERYYQIPETRELAAQYLLLYELSVPFGHDLNSQIDVDRSSTRFFVMFESLSAKELHAMDDAARQWLVENAPPHMHIAGTGLSLIWADITYRNIRSMLKGSIGALILISVTMAIALRSVRLGVLSLIPNLLPATMAFGIWGYTRVEVGLALSVIVAMTIGIVVDDTIHFLSKYERARRQHGLSSTRAIRYAFHTVGMAMITTTAALTAGFLILTRSNYRMSAEMGLMCALVIVVALVMDFLLLPAILLKLDHHPEPADQPLI
jgi:uncharacterized protein